MKKNSHFEYQSREAKVDIFKYQAHEPKFHCFLLIKGFFSKKLVLGLFN